LRQCSFCSTFRPLTDCSMWARREVSRGTAVQRAWGEAGRAA
jgi:hypothetical protein